jgi:hypothetical protein
MKRTSISLILLVALTLSLDLLSGVAVADPGVIAGNDVIDRTNGPDSWQNFYLMDRNSDFSENSIMTGFCAYIKLKDGEINPFEWVCSTNCVNDLNHSN